MVTPQSFNDANFLSNFVLEGRRREREAEEAPRDPFVVICLSLPPFAKEVAV